MKNKEKKVEEPSVEAMTDLCNEPSVEEMTKFFTLEQAKQELELFVKEKGVTCKFSEVAEDDETPAYYIEARIELGGKIRWASLKFNLFPMLVGCFGYQLIHMKTILERMSRADIPFYDNCKDIFFDSWDSSLTMNFCHSKSASDVANCVRLKLDLVWDGCGVNMFLSACKMKYGGWNADDNISPAIYSHHRKLTLIERAYIPSFEDLENSYNCWSTGYFNHAEIKNPSLDPKVPAIFQPTQNNDEFAQLYAKDFLIRMCKFSPRTGPNTDFAVTAALAEVLELDGVEILDSYSFPNYNGYYCHRWPEVTLPIVIAVAFVVNGRKFVYHRNTNFNEFHIDEVGTGNKLLIKEYITNTNVGRIRSTICRFLGVQL